MAGELFNLRNTEVYGLRLLFLRRKKTPFSVTLTMLWPEYVDRLGTPLI